MEKRNFENNIFTGMSKLRNYTLTFNPLKRKGLQKKFNKKCSLTAESKDYRKK